MKTRFGPLAAILTLIVGCAPGYYEKRPAYPEEAPAVQWTGMGYENPETGAERDMRMWREESGR
jgi:hypothetical protein